MSGKENRTKVLAYLKTHNVYNPQPLGYDLSKVMLLKKQYNCSICEIPKEAIEKCHIASQKTRRP